jgi:hypothetical protein
MQWENPFNSLAGRHLSHRKGPTRSTTSNCNHNTFKDLNAFLLAFSDLHVDSHSQTRAEIWSISKLSLLNRLYRVHLTAPVSHPRET